MLVHIHLLYAPKFSFAMPLPTTLRRFLMKSFNVSHVTVSLIDRNVLQHSMTGPDVGGLQHFHALQFHVRTFGMSPNVSQAIWGIFSSQLAFWISRVPSALPLSAIIYCSAPPEVRKTAFGQSPNKSPGYHLQAEIKVYALSEVEHDILSPWPMLFSHINR